MYTSDPQSKEIRGTLDQSIEINLPEMRASQIAIDDQIGPNTRSVGSQTEISKH